MGDLLPLTFAVAPREQANWVPNATLLWQHRRRIARTVLIGSLVSLGIAFVIPKHFESTARILPPSQGGGSAAALAALVGRSGSGMGAFSGLAGSLLGAGSTSAIYVDMLQSGTISGRLIDRFQLQAAWHKRYRTDAGKYLAHHTSIVDDKKSGVITLVVDDTNPERARNIAQGYLDELNQVVVHTSTSTARQERLFVEQRLRSVQADLEKAQLELSDFSSRHTTLDIKEQTRATVDAAAKLQGQMIAGESELSSLEQIYGNGNVRVRAAQSRIGILQHELKEVGGTDAPLPAEGADKPATNELYPPLRQLPRLAVPYADLYRQVRVQETVYELLTQEYELARIQEAKDTPVLSVLDAPGVPEKKSFPPRLVVTLILTFLIGVGICALVLLEDLWDRTSELDPRKVLLRSMYASRPARLRRSAQVEVNS